MTNKKKKKSHSQFHNAHSRLHLVELPYPWFSTKLHVSDNSISHDQSEKSQATISCLQSPEFNSNTSTTNYCAPFTYTGLLCCKVLLQYLHLWHNGTVVVFVFPWLCLIFCSFGFFTVRSGLLITWPFVCSHLHHFFCESWQLVRHPHFVYETFWSCGTAPTVI